MLYTILFKYFSTADNDKTKNEDDIKSFQKIPSFLIIFGTVLTW